MGVKKTFWSVHLFVNFSAKYYKFQRLERMASIVQEFNTDLTMLFWMDWHCAMCDQSWEFSHLPCQVIHNSLRGSGFFTGEGQNDKYLAKKKNCLSRNHRLENTGCVYSKRGLGQDFVGEQSLQLNINLKDAYILLFKVIHSISKQ